MKEEWRKIPSFPYYAVSSKGRVKALSRYVRFVDKLGNEQWRLKAERACSTQLQNGGYEIVHLYCDDKRTARTVHWLVTEAFLGRRPKGNDVCHNNGVRTDNRLKNLRYATRAQNFQDAKKHGTFYLRITGNKLTPAKVRYIRKYHESKSAKELAKKFGVKVEAIFKVWTQKTWSHVI